MKNTDTSSANPNESIRKSKTVKKLNNKAVKEPSYNPPKEVINKRPKEQSKKMSPDPVVIRNSNNATPKKGRTKTYYAQDYAKASTAKKLCQVVKTEELKKRPKTYKHCKTLPFSPLAVLHDAISANPSPQTIRSECELIRAVGPEAARILRGNSKLL